MEKRGFSPAQDKVVEIRALSHEVVSDRLATRSPLLSFWRGTSAHPAEFHLRASGIILSPRNEQTSPSLDVHHASPLAPLREQDSEKLEALFEGEQVQEIVLDVHRYIARVYPEPCWEDEPYEFLHGLI